MSYRLFCTQAGNGASWSSIARTAGVTLGQDECGAGSLLPASANRCVRSVASSSRARARASRT